MASYRLKIRARSEINNLVGNLEDNTNTEPIRLDMRRRHHRSNEEIDELTRPRRKRRRVLPVLPPLEEYEVRVPREFVSINDQLFPIPDRGNVDNVINVDPDPDNNNQIIDLSERAALPAVNYDGVTVPNVNYDDVAVSSSAEVVAQDSGVSNDDDRHEFDNLPALADEATWQLYCNGITDRCSVVTESAIWTDCEFSFKDSKETIQTHRLLLASASPVFATMFYGPLAETKFPVLLTDVYFEVFKEMLRFIVSSEARIPSIVFACELHYCSQKYMLPLLARCCADYLSRSMEPWNACFLLEYASLVDERDLIKQCVTTIQARTTEVLCSSSLDDVRLETLQLVFGLEPLGIHSEIELFAAVERYARAQDKKMLPVVQVIDMTEEAKTSKEVIDITDDEPRPSTSSQEEPQPSTSVVVITSTSKESHINTPGVIVRASTSNDAPKPSTSKAEPQPSSSGVERAINLNEESIPSTSKAVCLITPIEEYKPFTSKVEQPSTSGEIMAGNSKQETKPFMPNEVLCSSTSIEESKYSTLKEPEPSTSRIGEVNKCNRNTRASIFDEESKPGTSKKELSPSDSSKFKKTNDISKQSTLKEEPIPSTSKDSVMEVVDEQPMQSMLQESISDEDSDGDSLSKIIDQVLFGRYDILKPSTSKQEPWPSTSRDFGMNVKENTKFSTSNNIETKLSKKAEARRPKIVKTRIISTENSTGNKKGKSKSSTSKDSLVNTSEESRVSTSLKHSIDNILDDTQCTEEPGTSKEDRNEPNTSIDSVIDLSDDEPIRSPVEVIDLECPGHGGEPYNLTVRKKKKIINKIVHKGPWIGQGPRLDSPARKLLHQIRFLAMTPREFSECTNLDTLLTREEIFALLMNISSPHSYVRMPRHFSKCRKQRTMIQHQTSVLNYSTCIAESTAARRRAEHDVTVNSVTGLRAYHSAPFYALGVPWRLVVRPEYVNMADCQVKYLAVFLECNWESPEEWQCPADVTFCLMNARLRPPHVPRFLDYQGCSPYAHVQKLFETFSNKAPIKGFRMFILWEDMLHAVHNDAITLRVEVRERQYCIPTNCFDGGLMYNPLTLSMGDSMLHRPQQPAQPVRSGQSLYPLLGRPNQPGRLFCSIINNQY